MTRSTRRALPLFTGKPWEPSETDWHVDLVKVLRRDVRPDVLWLFIPNGFNVGPAVGARLKAMGQRAGAADLVFHYDPVLSRSKRLFCRVLWLELKERKGRAAKAQDTFAELAGVTGEHQVARSIEEAIGALWDRGILTRDARRLRAAA